MNINIKFDEQIANTLPDFKMIEIEADVTNNETSEELWNDLIKEGERIKSLYPIETINKPPKSTKNNAKVSKNENKIKNIPKFKNINSK